MEYQSHYLIEPNSALIEVFATYPQLSSIHNCYTLWSKDEGGYTSFNEDDYVLQVKLVFLLQLKKKLSTNANETTIEFRNVLFGNHPLTVEIFEKWWTIRRFTGYIDFFNILRIIDQELLDELGDSGNRRVDNWIRSIPSIFAEEDE